LLFNFSDDTFLLYSLRVSKYDVDKAFNKFEGFLEIKKRFSEFFDFTSKNFDKMMELFESGFCCPLTGRDSRGRKIVMFITRKWDTSIFSSMDVTRLIIYVVYVLSREEETQIAGISYIFDLKNITMSHISVPPNFKSFANFAKKYGTLQLEGFYLLNLPTFAAFIIKFFKKLLPKKLRTRFLVLESNDCLKNHIDLTIFPQEYGGNQTQTVMRRDFLLMEEKYREIILEHFKLEVDGTYALNIEQKNEDVCSFRKLEID
jgi:CRAL/TRIO domain